MTAMSADVIVKIVLTVNCIWYADGNSTLHRHFYTDSHEGWNTTLPLNTVPIKAISLTLLSTHADR